MGDHPSAIGTYGAIVTALLQRESTGKGDYVGTSLLANGVWANACFVQAALDARGSLPRPLRTEAFNALSNHYRCGDGSLGSFSRSASPRTQGCRPAVRRDARAA